MHLNPTAFIFNLLPSPYSTFFFFNDTATTEIYTLSLHDALPICRQQGLAPAAHRLPALSLSVVHRAAGARNQGHQGRGRHALPRQAGAQVCGHRPGGRPLRAQGHPGRGRPAGLRHSGRFLAPRNHRGVSQVLRRIGLPLLGAALVLALWWVGGALLARSTPVAAAFAPWPSLQALGQLLTGADIWMHTLLSLQRVAVGLLLAFVVGVPLGVLVGLSRGFSQAFSPVFQFLRMISPRSW